MNSKNLKILALDLATDFGCYRGDGVPFSLKLGTGADRLLQFFDWLNCELDETNYDLVVIENAVHQKGYANEVFLSLKALTALLCKQNALPLYGYTPPQIKKEFTGSGKADKDGVIKECQKRGFKIPYRVMKSGSSKGKRRYNDNAADAVAIYYTFTQRLERGENDRPI